MNRKWALCIAFMLGNPAPGNDPQWTSIKGQITFDGEPKAVAPLNITVDQAHCLDKGKLSDETWIVNKTNKGVKNVFIWLASDAASASGKDLPVHPSLREVKSIRVEIDQPNCAFHPHAVGIREGQTLVVKNSSPITHNVRWEPANSIRNKGDNRTIAGGGSVEVANLKQDRLPIAISCSIHPWMRGVIRVFDTPYFALSDESGAFEIKLAPVGKYRIFAWHEGCGWKGGAAGKSGDEIDIRAGSAMDLGQWKLKP